LTSLFNISFCFAISSLSVYISKLKLYSAFFLTSLNPTPAFTQYTFTSLGSLKLLLLYWTIFQILAADPVTPFEFGSPIAYPKFGVDSVLNSVIPKYNGGLSVIALAILGNNISTTVINVDKLANNTLFNFIFYTPFNLFYTIILFSQHRFLIIFYINFFHIIIPYGMQTFAFSLYFFHTLQLYYIYISKSSIYVNYTCSITISLHFDYLQYPSKYFYNYL